MLGCARASVIDDHVIPVAEGGGEEMGNHQGLCQACSDVKSSAEAVRGRLRALSRSKFTESHPGVRPPPP